MRHGPRHADDPIVDEEDSAERRETPLQRSLDGPHRGRRALDAAAETPRVYAVALAHLRQDVVGQTRIPVEQRRRILRENRERDDVVDDMARSLQRSVEHQAAHGIDERRQVGFVARGRTGMSRMPPAAA